MEVSVCPFLSKHHVSVTWSKLAVTVHVSCFPYVHRSINLRVDNEHVINSLHHPVRPPSLCIQSVCRRYHQEPGGGRLTIRRYPLPLISGPLVAGPHTTPLTSRGDSSAGGTRGNYSVSTRGRYGGCGADGGTLEDSGISV